MKSLVKRLNSKTLVIVTCTMLFASVIFPLGNSFAQQAIDAAATVETYNVTLTAADTEYSQALPEYTKFVYIQCRDSENVRGAFVTGKVAGSTSPYFTIKEDGSLALEGAALRSKTLYLATSVETSPVVEIVVGY
jgi:hypothetical protein